MRIRTLAVAFLLITSLASSAFAECIADLVMSAKSQMACCASGGDSCGKATASDCCKSEGQRQQHFTQLGASKVSPQATTPPPVVAVIIAAPSPNRIIRATQFVRLARALDGSPPPLYLLSGSFLI